MRLLYKIALAATLIGGSAAALLMPTASTPSRAVDATPSASRRQAIAFHERRLAEDPRSALDMSQLAALLMEEGRMSGDERAFFQAESLARRSLAERTRKNGRSSALLVNALLAQHKFAEARRLAEHLVLAEPDEPTYRGILTETQLEIGDYNAAAAQLGSLRAHREDLGLSPRFARWAELTGRIGEARRILRDAAHEAATRADLTPAQRAWFAMRLADLELRYGNLRSAANTIDEGLGQSPDDWRLLLTRARLEAAKGKWSSAITDLEEILARVSSPEALGLLAVAQRAVGNSMEADALESALEAAIQPGALHRSWAFVLVDEDKGLDAVVAAASADTLVRQDAHTLDLLAWTLHRAGRTAEALPLVRRALRTGLVEPSVRFHAGVIERASGNVDSARKHFELAASRPAALSQGQRAEMSRLQKATLLTSR